MGMNFTLIPQIVIMIQIKLAVQAVGGANKGREVVKNREFPL